MQRPRPFLIQASTSSTTPVTLLSFQINNDVKGVSALYVGLNPDPNGMYNIQIGKVFNSAIQNPTGISLNVIWQLIMAYIQDGWYAGITQGDTILIQHWSPTGVSITSEATAFISEVLGVPR